MVIKNKELSLDVNKNAGNKNIQRMKKIVFCCICRN